MAWTKEYRSEYMKKYREENRDQLNANRRYWYAHNKEHYCKSIKKYRENHRKEYNSYHRGYQKARRVKLVLDKLAQI